MIITEGCAHDGSDLRNADGRPGATAQEVHPDPREERPQVSSSATRSRSSRLGPFVTDPAELRNGGCRRGLRPGSPLLDHAARDRGQADLAWRLKRSPTHV